jgi:hypothetical protein
LPLVVMGQFGHGSLVDTSEVREAIVRAGQWRMLPVLTTNPLSWSPVFYLSHHPESRLDQFIWTRGHVGRTHLSKGANDPQADSIVKPFLRHLEFYERKKSSIWIPSQSPSILRYTLCRQSNERKTVV